MRRTDVDELNLRARTHMHAAGFLAGPSLTVPVGPYAERSFAAGDMVIARRNDYTRGLINGQRGVVTAVDPDAGTLTVHLGGTTATVPAAYLAGGGLDHGYALTVHQSQGMTCEQAMLLGSDALYREPATSDCPAAASATTCTWSTGTLTTIPAGRTATPRGAPSPRLRTRSPPYARRSRAAEPKPSPSAAEVSLS